MTTRTALYLLITSIVLGVVSCGLLITATVRTSGVALVITSIALGTLAVLASLAVLWGTRND